MSLLVHFYDCLWFWSRGAVLIEERTQDPSSTVRGERSRRCDLWVLRRKEPQWKASVSLGKGKKRGRQGFTHFKKLNRRGSVRPTEPLNERTFAPHDAQLSLQSQSHRVSLLATSALPRVRRVLQPLPQRGPGHAVRHLQRLHVPVRHLPRGCARLVQLLPGLRTRGAHQPHDGVVSDSGGVSHWLWVPLPAWKHLLNLQPLGVVGSPWGPISAGWQALCQERGSRAHLHLDRDVFPSKTDTVWAVPEPLPSQLLAVCWWRGCRWKRTQAGGNTCLQSCVYLSDVDLKPLTASFLMPITEIKFGCKGQSLEPKDSEHYFSWQMDLWHKLVH